MMGKPLAVFDESYQDESLKKKKQNNTTHKTKVADFTVTILAIAMLLHYNPNLFTC